MSPEQLHTAVLDWLLRRLESQRPVASDVVLLMDRPEVLPLDATRFAFGGRHWCFRRVKGELGLRDALPEDGDLPLIATVPDSRMEVVPPDVRARAHLQRTIELRAQDVVAALANRYCAPLHDDDLEQVVWRMLPELQRTTRRWTLGQTVRPEDVRAMAMAVLHGEDERPDRANPGELLARWLLQPPAGPEVRALLGASVTQAHGLEGAWLALALEQDSLQDLIWTGALIASAEGRRACPPWTQRPPGPAGEATREDQAWRALANLAQGAARVLLERDPETLERALAPAEQAFHRLRSAQPASFLMLRSAMEVALSDLARRAAQGQPASERELQLLAGSWHKLRYQEAFDAVHATCRLARALPALQPPPTAGGLETWATLGLDQVAWADRAARDLRRALAPVSGELAQAGQQVLTRYLEQRDALNRDFAEAVRVHWPRAAFASDVRGLLPVSALAGSIVGPLMRQVDRLFLVVLDGCDLSIFLELAEQLPAGVGLALPQLTGDAFSESLARTQPMRAALSLIPTVTGHARRAIFAGEIPDNPALDQPEAEAANASSDRTAFERNRSLPSPRHLFLKGDLQDGGAAMLQALSNTERGLVAAVFNSVDDALASHETTALGPWRPADLGAVLPEALRAAVEQGWVVLVTADHGHTPHWSSERKVASRGPHRYRQGAEDLEGAVVMDGSGIPGGPLTLLHHVGAYAGQQRRGYHGGVGLEEMLVPLAFLGAGHGRPQAPGWWSGEAASGGTERGAPPEPATSREPTPTSPVEARGLTPALQAQFEHVPSRLALLEALAHHGRLSVAQASAQVPSISAARMAGMVRAINATCRRSGLGEPIMVEGEGAEVVLVWVGPVVSR